MEIYKKNEITISTIEEQDKNKVLKYFSENTFNCDYETGALRPTSVEFIQIMDDIISGDDENNILVLKKDNEVIGYESIFVSYDRLVIGHIAVDKMYRNNGYGELLTKIAILIAENDDRDVTLYCNHKNKYFSKLKLKSIDNIHYIYRRQGIKTQSLPKIFVSVDEYKTRQEEKIRLEIEKFSNFMKQNKVFKLMDL